MGLITFRCTSCNVGLKVGADKAGRKIKCSKCGTVLTIPAADLDDDPPPAEEAPKLTDDGLDDLSAYKLIQAPSAEDAQAAKPETKSKKDEKKAPPPKRKFKSLPDPDLWEKVKAGLQIMMIGAYIWAGSVLFMGIILILSMTSGPQYADVLDNAMTLTIQTPAGEVKALDMPVFMLDLVAGKDNHGTAKTLYMLAALLGVFQFIVLLAGTGVCLKVPDRFGTQGQLKALLALCAINLFVVLLFKLIPVLGVSNYFLVPYALPEVSLVDANIDRDPLLWIFWSPSPFWEMILEVIFLCAFYGVPVLIGVFLWSIGMSLKEDPIIRQGQGHREYVPRHRLRTA